MFNFLRRAVNVTVVMPARRTHVMRLGESAFVDVVDIKAAYLDEHDSLVIRIGNQGIIRLTKFDLYKSPAATVEDLYNTKREIENESA